MRKQSGEQENHLKRIHAFIAILEPITYFIHKYLTVLATICLYNYICYRGSNPLCLIVKEPCGWLSVILKNELPYSRPSDVPYTPFATFEVKHGALQTLYHVVLFVSIACLLCPILNILILKLDILFLQETWNSLYLSRPYLIEIVDLSIYTIPYYYPIGCNIVKDAHVFEWGRSNYLPQSPAIREELVLQFCYLHSPRNI